MTVPARDPAAVAGFQTSIQSLAPVLAQHRDALDRDRRMPKPLFDAIADAGLLKLWLPKALGGPELSPLDFMEVVEAAAALDGSVGWIVGNGGGMSRAGGYLTHDAAKAVFDDPRCLIAGSTGASGSAMEVEGGYRVTGRWPFGSGIHHATRIMGVCGVAKPGQSGAPVPVCCYFAPADVSIIDNWHVSGLRGSGSCDFEVKDVFVPTSLTHPFLDLQPTQSGLLYRMPPLSVFALTVSVVPLGIARGALDALKKLADTKIRLGTSAPLREREIVQADVGRAETLHAAARALSISAMSELMAATSEGGDRLVMARARFRAACSFAAESAVEIVDRMAETAGAAAIFETQPIERCARDVRAAVKHIAMSPNNYLVAGRLQLGLDAGTVRF